MLYFGFRFSGPLIASTSQDSLRSKVDALNIQWLVRSARSMDTAMIMVALIITHIVVLVAPG